MNPNENQSLNQPPQPEAPQPQAPVPPIVQPVQPQEALLTPSTPVVPPTPTQPSPPPAGQPQVQSNFQSWQTPDSAQMQSNVGVGQTGGYGVQVKNHMALAIVSFFFSWPFGIPAIIFASKVNSSLASGDIAGAEKSAKTAKILSILAFVSFFFFVILAVIVIGFTGANAKRKAQEQMGITDININNEDQSMNTFDADDFSIKYPDVGAIKKISEEVKSLLQQ